MRHCATSNNIPSTNASNGQNFSISLTISFSLFDFGPFFKTRSKVLVDSTSRKKEIPSVIGVSSVEPIISTTRFCGLVKLSIKLTQCPYSSCTKVWTSAGKNVLGLAFGSVVTNERQNGFLVRPSNGCIAAVGKKGTRYLGVSMTRTSYFGVICTHSSCAITWRTLRNSIVVFTNSLSGTCWCFSSALLMSSTVGLHL